MIGNRCANLYSTLVRYIYVAPNLCTGGDAVTQHKMAEETDERAGGRCPRCGAAAEYRTCEVCGTSAWIIDCGHYSQPRPIAASQDGQRYLCEDCEGAEE